MHLRLLDLSLRSSITHCYRTELVLISSTSTQICDVPLLIRDIVSEAAGLAASQPALVLLVRGTRNDTSCRISDPPISKCYASCYFCLVLAFYSPSFIAVTRLS